jgi:general secretion pathway protein L
MASSDSFSGLRTLSLTSTLSLEELGDRLREALLVCAPEVVRQWLSRRDPRVIVAPRDGKADILEAQSGEEQLIGDFDPHAPEAIGAMLASVRSRDHRTVLRLPASQVLIRSVSFPAQVRDNLAQVVRYEIDRLSPFQADQVYFDFRLRSEPPGAGKVGVDLALCRRDDASGWLERVRGSGTPVDALSWEGAWPKANLLPVVERPGRRGRLFNLSILLLGTILILGAVALVTPLWQKQRFRAELLGQVQALKAKADRVFQTRDALERARKGSVAVLERKADQPLVIDLLRVLTAKLPDDTWVQNLDIRDGQVQIRGESGQATALLGLLEKAPGISAVTFSSPVVQVATTGRERFHISFKYQRPKSS